MKRIASQAWAVLLIPAGGCAPAATAPVPLRAVPFTGVQDVFGRNAVGDAIVITAVRGTADAVAAGHAYEIDGAYTLASHDAAELSANVTTADDAAPHRSPIGGQSVVVRRGSGTFALRLRVADAGWPHVSLYPVGGGSSFAGEYFGTGGTLPPMAWQVSAASPR